MEVVGKEYRHMLVHLFHSANSVCVSG